MLGGIQKTVNPRSHGLYQGRIQYIIVGYNIPLQDTIYHCRIQYTIVGYDTIYQGRIQYTIVGQDTIYHCRIGYNIPLQDRIQYTMVGQDTIYKQGAYTGFQSGGVKFSTPLTIFAPPPGLKSAVLFFIKSNYHISPMQPIVVTIQCMYVCMEVQFCITF